MPTEFSVGVYDRLVEVGAAHGLAHAGMATLESTRTEAGRLDYGLDMENSDSPLEAGLKFAIDFDKPGGFVGRDALLAQYEQRPYRNRLVQFLLDDPEPLLYGEEPILLEGEPVGYVRSGAYGHTLGGAMGFGYVEHPDGVTGDLVRDGRLRDPRGRRTVRGARLVAVDVRPDERTRPHVTRPGPADPSAPHPLPLRLHDRCAIRSGFRDTGGTNRARARRRIAVCVTMSASPTRARHRRLGLPPRCPTRDEEMT